MYIPRTASLALSATKSHADYAIKWRINARLRINYTFASSQHEFFAIHIYINVHICTYMLRCIYVCMPLFDFLATAVLVFIYISIYQFSCVAHTPCTSICG